MPAALRFLSAVLLFVPPPYAEAFSHLNSFAFSRGATVGRSPASCASTSSTRLAACRVKPCDVYAETVLKRPRWGGPVIGPIVRYLNSALFGIVFSFLLGVLNKFKSYRKPLLLHHIFHREKGRPLLTVSNHQSVLDDPGLWAVLLPWWRLRPEQMRWQICTEDVFFASKWLQPLIAAGNCMPLDRTGSLEQPLFKRFHEKLVGGAWCHIYSEGRVWQNWRFGEGQPRLGPFKPGIGKLIAHCPEGKDPIVIPMYHTGMDSIVPEVVLGGDQRKKNKPSRPISFRPNIGKQIRFYIGSPISFKEKVALFREKNPGKLDSWYGISQEAIELYMEITQEIREKVLLLEKEAREAS